MPWNARAATIDDMPAIKDLADRVFRSNRPGHMAAEFPYLYDNTNAHHWAIATDGETIASIVGTMVWDAIIEGVPTRAASIGSVATDPRFRGQGLAARLLSLMETMLHKESVRIVLISGDLPLYLRYGARSIGHVQWYPRPSHILNSPRYRVRAIDPRTDAPTIARLYQTKTTRLVRNLSQLHTMLVTQPITQVEQGTKLASLVLYDDKPVSYLIVNHKPFGGKYASRLVEWSGDPQGVLFGLRHIPDPPDQGILIPVLPEDLSLKEALRPLVPVSCTPIPWLAKVIDGPGLFHDLEEIWSKRSSLPIRVNYQSQDLYHIEQGKDTWSVDPAQLTQWVFGHTVDTRPPALNALFPLPSLWPQGLNYI